MPLSDNKTDQRATNINPWTVDAPADGKNLTFETEVSVSFSSFRYGSSLGILVSFALHSSFLDTETRENGCERCHTCKSVGELRAKKKLHGKKSTNIFVHKQKLLHA